MKTVTRYETFDGRVFDSEIKALEHEKQLDVRKAVEEILLKWEPVAFPESWALPLVRKSLINYILEKLLDLQKALVGSSPATFGKPSDEIRILDCVKRKDPESVHVDTLTEILEQPVCYVQKTLDRMVRDGTIGLSLEKDCYCLRNFTAETAVLEILQSHGKVAATRAEIIEGLRGQHPWKLIDKALISLIHRGIVFQQGDLFTLLHKGSNEVPSNSVLTAMENEVLCAIRKGCARTLADLKSNYPKKTAEELTSILQTLQVKGFIYYHRDHYAVTLQGQHEDSHKYSTLKAHCRAVLEDRILQAVAKHPMTMKELIGYLELGEASWENLDGILTSLVVFGKLAKVHHKGKRVAVYQIPKVTEENDGTRDTDWLTVKSKIREMVAKNPGCTKKEILTITGLGSTVSLTVFSHALEDLVIHEELSKTRDRARHLDVYHDCSKFTKKLKPVC